MSFLQSLPEDLENMILKITNQNQEALPVFQKLYDHLKSDENDLKRRKLTTVVPSQTQEITSISPESIIFQLRDVSFQAPLRKKLSLTISISPINQKPIISIAKSNELKPDLILPDITNTNIKFAALLPVPEKKNQTYLIIFYNKSTTSSENNEPIVIIYNDDQITKQLIAEDKIMKPQDNLMVFLKRQAQISGFTLTSPFSTQTLTPVSYVQAYRGTKEGLLYFLPGHILFGFKKPITLFPLHEVASITYTSITRVTFNVTLALKSGGTVEFSMIDQQDFAAIDAYVKNMNVQDMSMSEELKAKTISKSQDQQSEGNLADAEAEVDENIQQGEAQLASQQDQDDDSDDEEEDGDFEVHGEIDDTSDVSSEGDSDDENIQGGEEDEEDEDEEDENAEIELNSDDD